MRIFLDTSSLIKLYHFEIGTLELDVFFEENSITEICLSELTKIEYDSAIWKKVRVGDLNKTESEALISSFRADYGKYTFINLNTKTVEKSQKLIATYGMEGLRTLDSLQLASALIEQTEIDFFISSDKLLNKLAEKENFKIMI